MLKPYSRDDTTQHPPPCRSIWEKFKEIEGINNNNLVVELNDDIGNIPFESEQPSKPSVNVIVLLSKFKNIEIWIKLYQKCNLVLFNYSNLSSFQFEAILPLKS